ncbi:hypothetical protein H2248_000049 [Termitomyces sp. 'cryptogamus']|nr:hypothetical protein H2248_000049 [Termitomyces sp. 'cryptogamus']
MTLQFGSGDCAAAGTWPLPHLAEALSDAEKGGPDSKPDPASPVTFSHMFPSLHPLGPPSLDSLVAHPRVPSFLSISAVSGNKPYAHNGLLFTKTSVFLTKWTYILLLLSRNAPTHITGFCGFWPPHEPSLAPVHTA